MTPNCGGQGCACRTEWPSDSIVSIATGGDVWANVAGGYRNERSLGESAELRRGSEVAAVDGDSPVLVQDGPRLRGRGIRLPRNCGGSRYVRRDRED